MIKKLNKRIFFRVSLLVSSFLAVFFGMTTKNDTQQLVKTLDLPILSIEKAYATGDSGSCCGSSDGGINFPPGPVGGIGIKLVAPTSATFSCGGCGCFIAGTKITMSDGTLKNIEEIKAGEYVMSSKGPRIVEETFVRGEWKGDLFAFNGSNTYFVTGAHPFMTTEGWKSLDLEATKRENPGLDISLLRTGDSILKNDESSVSLVSIEKKYTEVSVYNLQIEGEHDYFADSFWVHNVANQRK